jgi:hypothetical protein
MSISSVLPPAPDYVPFRHMIADAEPSQMVAGLVRSTPENAGPVSSRTAKVGAWSSVGSTIFEEDISWLRIEAKKVNSRSPRSIVRSRCTSARA